MRRLTLLGRWVFSEKAEHLHQMKSYVFVAI